MTAEMNVFSVYTYTHTHTMVSDVLKQATQCSFCLFLLTQRHIACKCDICLPQTWYVLQNSQQLLIRTEPEKWDLSDKKRDRWSVAKRGGTFKNITTIIIKVYTVKLQTVDLLPQAFNGIT